MDLSERSQQPTGRHPWELARLAFFRSVLARQRVLNDQRWLDVGAGDAWFATSLRASLRQGASITCWDPYYTSEDLAGAPEAGTGVTLTDERPGGHFDGALMLDVVEHVEHDVAFVKDIVDTMVKPGGWVLVSVPAYQALFTEHDRQLKHFRRYSPAQCRRTLEAAGLTVQAEGGLFHALLLPRAIAALMERRRATPPTTTGVGAWTGGELLTRIVNAYFALEGRGSLLLSRQRRFVVPGLSYWAFCRKSEEA